MQDQIIPVPKCTPERENAKDLQEVMETGWTKNIKLVSFH